MHGKFVGGNVRHCSVNELGCIILREVKKLSFLARTQWST